MSTIATKFSSASTQFKVGTAAVALVAAATLTPAAAVAAPPSLTIAQSVGTSIEGLSSLPVVATGLNATANASSGAAPIISQGLVGLASIPLYAVVALRDTAYTIGNVLGGADSLIGGLFIGFGNGLNEALEEGPFVPYQA